MTEGLRLSAVLGLRQLQGLQVQVQLRITEGAPGSQDTALQRTEGQRDTGAWPASTPKDLPSPLHSESMSTYHVPAREAAALKNLWSLHRDLKIIEDPKAVFLLFFIEETKIEELH